jgi:nucleoside-diphosphate-sugar epimerase
MRCTVIGGAGFLGGAIVQELLSRGDEVRSADRSAHSLGPDVEAVRCDILEPQTIAAAIRGADEVYHIAGVLGTAELNQAVNRAIRVNIEGAVNVFEQCRLEGVARVFYPGKPNCWLNTYTITKEAADQFAKMFSDSGLCITRMRWFNAYGPGQHLQPVRKIIPTFMACCLMDRPIPIWGTGENTVDMIYSPDLARITVDATRHGLNGTVFDLGTGKARTVLEVARDVIAVAGGSNVPRNPAASDRQNAARPKRAMWHQPMRPGETENTKLRANMHDLTVRLAARNAPVRFTPWEEALRATWEHYAALPTDEIRSALDHHGLL